MALTPLMGVLRREEWGRFGQRHRHTQRAPHGDSSKVGVRQFQAKDAKDGRQPEAEERHGRTCPKSLRGRAALLTLLTSGPPDSERMDFYCFKPLASSHFATAALGDCVTHPARSWPLPIPRQVLHLPASQCF